MMMGDNDNGSPGRTTGARNETEVEGGGDENSEGISQLGQKVERKGT